MSKSDVHEIRENMIAAKIFTTRLRDGSQML